MATEKKTTKKAATTKPKSASTAKKTTTRRASTPKPKAATIRNLRGTVVHARLYSQDPEKPFRIALQPRGVQGDTTTVPASLVNDYTFTQGVGILWEIITTAEAREAEYAPVGYLGRSDSPQILRPEDTTVMTAEDWDGKGRVPQDRRTSTGKQASEREFGTGMHTADVPGSDSGLHAQLKAAQKAGETALPDGVDIQSRRVAVERVRGA